MGLSYQVSWPLITSTAYIVYKNIGLTICCFRSKSAHKIYKDKQFDLLEKAFSFSPFSPHYTLSHTTTHCGLIHQMHCISAHNIFVTHNGSALQIIVYQRSSNQLTHSRYCPSTHCILALKMHYVHNFVCEETLGQTQHPSKLLLATFLDLG